MKTKLTSLLLAMLMLLSIPTVLAEDTTNGLPTGTIVGSVTVYDGPWSDANVVGSLENGTAVIVMQQNGDRTQVFARAQRLAGWIVSSGVQVNPQTPVYPGIVISQNVSLRTDKSTGATRLASIPNGTVLDLLDEQNGWYYVNYWDTKTMTATQGWVLVDYIVRDPSFITTTKSTYVYSTPTRDSKKVGQLVSGTQLVVIGEYGDFWVVNLRSASGFIYKGDIDADQISGGNG